MGRTIDYDKLSLCQEAFHAAKLAERDLGATRKEGELLAAAFLAHDDDTTFTLLKLIRQRRMEQAAAEVRQAARTAKKTTALPKSLREMSLNERTDLFRRDRNLYLRLAAEG